MKDELMYDRKVDDVFEIFSAPQRNLAVFVRGPQSGECFGSILCFMLPFVKPLVKTVINFLPRTVTYTVMKKRTQKTLIHQMTNYCE